MAVVVLAFTTGRNGSNYFGETTKTTQKWNNNEDSWERLNVTKSSSRNHLMKITETLVNDWNQSESQALPNVTNASINSPPTEAMRQDFQNVTLNNSTSDTNSSLKNTTVTTINNNDRSKHKYNTSHNVIHSSISCPWSPNSHAECLALLSSRLPPVSQRRHWFLFGDSTMRMLMFGKLKQKIVTKPLSTCRACHVSTGERCRNNVAFGLTIPNNWTWHPPSEFEGPIDHGLKHPHCMDCSSCLSTFVSCNHPCHIPYGGYFAMEFARDVELQSNEYTTTQENLAQFLKQWMTAANTTSLDQSIICIINVGTHDISIPTLTDESFFSNLKWMFHLLNPLCGHFVWIHLTAPFNETFPQKTPRLKRWNDGVLQMLHTSPELRHKASVVDLFAASQHWKHRDNVHMDWKWYVSLGDFLLKLF